MSDGIVLIGLPGSGKSSIGRRVAALLDRPFVDVDEETQRMCGMAPAEVIKRFGERRLREIDQKAVEHACAIKGAVIATGGGTPLEPLNRWAFLEHGVRIGLNAPLDVLAARLSGDVVERPLLGGDVAAGLERTGRERAPIYRAVDATTDAGCEPDDVAADVVRIVNQGAREPDWRPLLDATFARHHPIGPEHGRLLMGRGLDASALQLDGTPAYVVDRRSPMRIDGGRVYELDGGEHVKSMAELEGLLEWMSAIQLERTDPLVVVGGGTVGDLGGLAAALHRRGVPLVNVPTTWLAQADSAIGGKVAIDLPDAKNGVGAFWPAALIVEDADALATLPLEKRRDGIAECLKAGLIGDPLLWQLIESRGLAALHGDDPAAAYAMTERAVLVKLDIVARDPYEVGERRKLNLGHTLGHAFEIESGYTLAHGAAIALGLRAVARIGKGRGAQPDVCERVDHVLAELGFGLTRRFDRAAVVAAIGSDKKRSGGRQRWILPMGVGEVIEVDDVTDAELDAALDAVRA